MRQFYLTPAQFIAGTASNSLFRVAGRVFDVVHGDASTVLRLVDACASVAVELSSLERELRAGDYAVLIGEACVDSDESVRLHRAKIQHIWPAELPAETSEFCRTAFGPRGRQIALRGYAFKCLRTQFEQAGFLEVDTPVRVVSPGSDAYVNAFASEERFLITSPEHHMKRLVAAGFPQIFQLAHCFRRDESGHLHQPEFLMLEWYRAFASQVEMMEDTESIVVSTVSALQSEVERLGWGLPSRAVANAKKGVVDSLTIDALTIDLARPFERLSVRDAFRQFADIEDAVDLAGTDEDRYFQTFVDRVEPALALATRPIFLCEFPSTQAALAQYKSTDTSVAERFELYLAGVELCNGYTELTQPSDWLAREQAEKQRREHAGAPDYPADQALFSALVAGFPPCGGNALGVDRLIALALGKRDIREVVTFISESQ